MSTSPLEPSKQVVDGPPKQFVPPSTKQTGAQPVARDAQTQSSPTHDPMADDLWTEPLSSRDLTWIAEGAHGQLDEDLELIRIGVKTYRLRKRGVTPPASPPIGGGAPPREDIATVVLRIRTSSPNHNQVKPAAVSVQLESESKPIQLSERCDAVFWTASAIQKFLIPYYEAHRMLSDTDMRAFNKRVREEKVLAVAHVPPSHTLIGEELGYDYHEAFTFYTTPKPSLDGPQVPGAVKEETLTDFIKAASPQAATDETGDLG